MFLGYYGDRVKQSGGKDKEFDWFVSRFGGSSSALQAAILASLGPEDDTKLATIGQCECCKGPLALVAAIHAPQTLCPTQAPPTGLAAIAANSVLNPNYKPPQGEDDDELRVLLILACNEPRCWKIHRATWKAYRFHPHIVLSEEEIKRIKDEKAAAFRRTIKPTGYKDEDDLPAAKKTPATTPVKAVFATPSWGSPFGGGSSFGGGFSSPSSSQSSATTSQSSAPATPSADVDLEALLKARDSSIEAKSKPKPSTPSSSSASTATTASSSKPQSTSISTATEEGAQEFRFEEAYIEFDKEPEIASYSGSGDIDVHEKKKDEPLSEGADGTWAGEGYESSVSAKDKPFHRFHKRLQRAPEQCLRYWRGAEPLYSSANAPRNVPSCSCGARRVAEVQLTPALIYLLKPVNPKLETNLDFGTVITYTCSVNCTTARQPLHAEHIELQKGM